MDIYSKVTIQICLLSLAIIILAFILASIFSSSSCRLGSVSNIDSGVSVITKCCKDISVVGEEGYKLIEKVEVKTDDTSNSKGLLPTYSWDAKQMLW